jgi:t-SNARE complex subunit (syntaxin)
MHEVKLTENELTFIRDAITEKYDNIMSQIVFRPSPTLEEVSNMAEFEFEKELEKFAGKKSSFAYRSKNKKAPYGLKKDGTPKKKSGRPTKELF